MESEPQHILYPLSLSLGISILLDFIGLLDALKDKVSAYLVGLLIMWISWCIVYYTFIRRKE